MTLPAILRLTGKKVGDVRGSARPRDAKDNERKGKIVVLAYEHTVVAEATDKTSPLGKPGTPSDKRTHGVFTITKPIDRASPILQKAAAEGDEFTTFVLQCFRVPPAGGGPNSVLEEGHWKVVLQGARIASIKWSMKNVRVPANSAMPELEEVAFTYESIGFGWQALTGNGGEVATVDAAAMSGDFRKSDAEMIGKRIVDNAGKAIGGEVGKQIGAFLKDEGKKMFLDALKEK